MAFDIVLRNPGSTFNVNLGLNAYILSGGTWYQVSDAYILVDGSWKQGIELKVLVDGNWKAV